MNTTLHQQERNVLSRSWSLNFVLRVGLLLVVGLLLTVVANSAPVPWTVSNLNPEGESTYVRDFNGEVLPGNFRVHLILDIEGDGPDLPDNEHGLPTDDDVLLASWVSIPGEGVIPQGSFEFYSTEDSDALDNLVAYIRAFDEVDPQQGTYYVNSEVFNGPTVPQNVQTIVLMPDRMTTVIGNQRPYLTYDPIAVDIAAGDEAVVIVSVADDNEELTFRVNCDSLPGGALNVTTTRLSPTQLRISWISPFDATGSRQLTCIVSDGFYEVFLPIVFSVTAPTELPRAFHLLSPVDMGTLWETVGFSWQASQDLHGQEIWYAIYWATREDFADADSLINLEATTITIDFDPRVEGYNPSNPDLGEVLKLPRKHSEIGRLKEHNHGNLSRGNHLEPSLPGSSVFKENLPATEFDVELPGQLITSDDLIQNPQVKSLYSTPSGLPEESPTLTVFEGDTIYWRVRAYDADRNNRWSSDTWRALAEIPDPPSQFSLIYPRDGEHLLTLTPTLNWTASTDPDRDDEVSYEVIWSVNNWTTSDTISGIVGTTFTFDGDHLALFPGAERFLETLFATLSSHAVQLDEFVNQAKVDWKVDAVDLIRLRTPSRESWSFTLQDPHAPTYFELVQPVDGYVLQPEDSVVTFSWRSSMDPDGFTGLQYTFRLANNPDFENSGNVVLTDTTYRFLRVDFRWEEMVYYWKVEARDVTGSMTASEQVWSFEVPLWTSSGNQRELPTKLELSAVYPNPFNPSISVELAVPKTEKLTLRIMNILGQEMLKWGPHEVPAGYQRITLNLDARPSGHYFLVMENNDGVVARKHITLVK